MVDIKTQQELKDHLELSKGNRGITAEFIKEMIQSMVGITGVMTTTNGSAPILCDGKWKRIDTWEKSIDTRGVQDGLKEIIPEGWYKIKNHADGDWTYRGMVRIIVDKAGKYRMRAVLVNIDESISILGSRDQALFEVDEEKLLIIEGFKKNIERGQKIQLEIRGPNEGSATVTFGYFAIDRK